MHASVYWSLILNPSSCHYWIYLVINIKCHQRESSRTKRDDATKLKNRYVHAWDDVFFVSRERERLEKLAHIVLFLHQHIERLGKSWPIIVLSISLSICWLHRVFGLLPGGFVAELKVEEDYCSFGPTSRCSPQPAAVQSPAAFEAE